MKKQFLLLALAAVLAIPFSSCKKDSATLPAITTTVVSSISPTSAISGGTITSAGSSAITVSGICLSKTANPTILDQKTSDGPLSGTFITTITGLTSGTTYHIRAYATSADGTGYGEDITFSTGSQLKSVSFYADWAGGTEKWDFSFDAATNAVTKFIDYWEGSVDKTVTYDYSTPGTLNLKKDGAAYRKYDYNAKGQVTKDYDSGDEYEYNADGFLTKTFETWSGSKVIHNEMTITNGNITKITTYDDAGTTAKKIKEFTYTSGDNVNGIHQANAIDSDWKPVGGFYGKPSTKLVDYFEYWDPRSTPISKSRSTLGSGYTFDSKNRPTKIVKSLTDGSTETWSYTYVD